MEKQLTKRLPVLSSRRPDGTFEYKPLYVVWETTLRCDQSCRFCGTRAGRARDDELTTVEALDVVDQLAAMGTREVAMHGGEAYLREDWLTIVSRIRELGMDATMVTGGRGFTVELAREAKAAGLTAVSMSIDGVESTHDGLRGLKGSHASALRAMGWLRDAGVPVGCNTQLNRQNYHELPKILDIIAPFKPYGWQVQLMVPMGRAADHEDLWLQPFDLLELMPSVADARTLCDSRGIKLWPGDNIGYFGPYEHQIRFERTRSGHSGGCGGGVIAMGLESHGDVKGCSAMGAQGFVGGNVRTSRIADLWKDAPALCLTRNFTLDDLWGYCRSCYYGEICKGGCVWTASTILGKRGNNPYCHHRALEMLRKGKRERLVQVRRAAGLIRDTALFELVEEDAPSEWVESLPPVPGAVA